MNFTEVVLIKLTLFHLFKTATMLTLQSYHFASHKMPSQILAEEHAFVQCVPAAIFVNQAIL